MARARATYLSEREKDFLHEKTLEVLEKVGVAYNTPQAIDLLASAAGAEVGGPGRAHGEAQSAGRLRGHAHGPRLRPRRGRQHAGLRLDGGAETVSPAKVIMWTATSWG